ncbi:MAG: serine/threonine protein kinase, partial [Polyangiaceae bacterium]|nr:serine/threonine protein kinase [Polyangiaceae bacterium]
MPRCPACHRRVPDGGACPTHNIAPPAPPISDGSVGFDRPHVPGFTVSRLLGRGGFSVVWEATREEDGVPVAVKVSRTDHSLAHARFRRDAEVLGRVGPPFVPRIYQSGRLDDGRPYIAMERLVGSTLAGVLENAPAAPDIRWAVSVADSVLAVLEQVHACELLHRDIKPENIYLCSAEARVVLIDFGLARARHTGGEDALTRAGAAVGTPEYMSPEQIRGERTIDATTDIYSFGIVLFELLTHRLPFIGDIHHIEHAHQALRPPRPGDIIPLPELLSEITLACLEKDPVRRPPTAALVRRALADFIAVADAGSGMVNAPACPSSTSRQPLSKPSGRLLASARRALVLLVLENIGSNAALITAAITRRKGVVARQRGSRCVCVFSGEDMDSPARVAALAAQELTS